MAKAARQRRINRARKDPAFFVEYAFRQEKGGRPIRNEPFHREWQDFFSSVNLGVIEASVELGKTVQIGLARVIWEIGNNPELRCLLLGESKEAAQKLLANIILHIERNPRIHEVFPNLKKRGYKGDKWNNENIVIARKSMARDPTIQARGPLSKNILGSRLDLVIVDDLLNMENTRTQLMRDKLYIWFDDYVMTRIEDEYSEQILGRCFFIGNPWHQDDLMARLKGRPGWEFITTPIVENPDDPPSQWRPVWRSRWPLERIMAKRAMINPTSFARKYLCKILEEGMRRFRKAWIDHMFRLGKGRTFLTKQPRGRAGRFLRCFTGVDLAVGKKDISAFSCLFTIALDELFRRIVVDVRQGHWTGPEIVSEMEEVSRIFDSEMIVESNGVQEYIAQFGLEHGISCSTHYTGNNKWDEEYGVESVAIEIKNGMWVAPSGLTGHEIHPVLAEWEQQMLNFDPGEHTGDLLMGSWMAREGARRFAGKNFQKSDHNVR